MAKSGQSAFFSHKFYPFFFPLPPELNLEGNLLHRLPEELGSLLHLRAINLARNKFRRFPEPLAAAPALESIDLEGNEIAGERGRGWGWKPGAKEVSVQLLLDLLLGSSIWWPPLGDLVLAWLELEAQRPPWPHGWRPPSQPDPPPRDHQSLPALGGHPAGFLCFSKKKATTAFLHHLIGSTGRGGGLLGVSSWPATPSQVLPSPAKAPHSQLYLLDHREAPGSP